ncbi:MAG: 16S rRNA (adenine(1518)-N(6)/adenine(1519)-N(6))-dimethyltransferase RsmA [Rhodobacterales bacterium]|jgi:16S rRNA (adenine1518-N6/adenine1519-N6)-dimethyltransferase
MTAIDKLPAISAVIKKYKLNAKKNLGQNFLLDLNLTAKIARSCKDLAESTIIEIGPGPGGLTRGLLSENAKKIIAIEKDVRCIPALTEIAEYYPGKLEIIQGDALTYLISSDTASPVHIFSNLPYNIGTVLLTKWLDPPEWPPIWNSLTLMFQKELAERLIAQPGSKQYGRLSILTQWRSDPRIILRLSSKEFYPRPKVDSAVVQIKRLKEPRFPAKSSTLTKLVSKAFNQRRKMLRTSLKDYIPNVVEALELANILPSNRAEDLSVEQYCNLANILDKN